MPRQRSYGASQPIPTTRSFRQLGVDIPIGSVWGTELAKHLIAQ